MIRCITPDCGRARQTPTGGTAYAYCPDCTALLLRAAFGDFDFPAPVRSAPPRRDQAADLTDWAPGELEAAWGK